MWQRRLFYFVCLASIAIGILFFFHKEETPLTRFEQKIASHQGKIVYVDFWASWCGPCRESFPWLNQLQQRYSPDKLVIVSVNVDANKENAQKFLAQYPANFEITYDAAGVLAKAYGIKGMPSSMLLDQKGKEVSRHTGFNHIKKKQYEAEIEMLLAR